MIARHARCSILVAIAIACPPGLAAAAHVRPTIAPDWQTRATPEDRARLRLWRVAWAEGLRQAKAGGAVASAAIAADGMLFDPDLALPDPAPPAGLYRCRTYKLGAQRTGDAVFAALPPQPCRITAGRLIVGGGMQRPAGRLFQHDTTRLVFLGALALGDEPRALDYGCDSVRDMAGFLERIGADRWRLMLPRPHWQSQLDIVEIVPDMR